MQRATQPKLYNFNITKFYKVWFSQYPDVFLGLENELNFIRLRTNHPDAQLTFIYSGKCLNETALKRLKEFCQRYNITTINFDTELLPLLDNAHDKKLYKFATLELDNKLSNNYGSFAASSDCVRLMKAVIERFGIYSDYDVEFNLRPLSDQADFIQLKAPVLLSVCFLPSLQGQQVSNNSDFLAFATDLYDGKLVPEALQALENLQVRAINNYSTRFTLLKLLSIDKKSLPPTSEIALLYAAIVNGNPVENVFEFRRLCSAYFANKTQVKENLKELFTIAGVNCMAGPGMYNYLYQHHAPEPFNGQAAPLGSRREWSDYLEIYDKSDVNYYPKLKECIHLTNRVDAVLTRGKRGGDFSWTEEGAKRKRAQESVMHAAGKTLLFALRSKEAAHASLILRAKAFCSEEYLKLLKEKKYSLVLRRACNDLNLKLIELILSYQHRITLKLDECSSNGNNALDWAIKSKQTNETNRMKICDLLNKAGLKPACISQPK